MKSFKEFLNEEKTSKSLVVNIRGNISMLLESTQVIEEGKTKGNYSAQN